VLVIDEMGYLTLPEQDAANVLYRVVDARHQAKKAMIVTTNKALAAWGQVLHDGDLACAIIDRILGRGQLFELRGLSYRTRHIAPEKLGVDPELLTPGRPTEEGVMQMT
jgi:DNA replication protein DnaC